MLTEREAKILDIIVEFYIRKGEPVGSSYISSHYNEKGRFLSPATIRNIFKKMEGKGLIEKTHLSSGRVPTKKGFRVYLENLIEDFKNKNTLEKNLLRELRFNRGDLMSDLEGYAEVLEKETGAVSFLLLPDFFTTKIKRIEFVKLSERKVLAVVVSVNNLFRESVIEMPYTVSHDDLVVASNYLNHKFSGLTLFDIKKRLFDSIKEGVSQLNDMAKRVIKLAYQNIEKISQEENGLIIKGLPNILDDRYIKEVKVLKTLMENFESKKKFYQLIAGYINKELTVNLDFPAENFSFIISTYSITGGSKGAFGLIGPLRMDYRKNISIMKEITHSMIEQMFVK